MKIAKAFRFSDQAVEALHYLSEQTGTNETAILEMSLVHYRRAFDNSKLEELKEITGKTIENRQIANVVSLDRKKRKRSKK